MDNKNNENDFDLQESESQQYSNIVFQDGSEKTKNKGKKKFIVIIVLIILILLSVTGYYLVNKRNLKNENEVISKNEGLLEDGTTNSEENDNSKEETVIDKKVDNLLAQKLYSYIPYMTCYHGERNVYQGNNVVTFELTDDALILRKAWDSLELKDSQITCIDLPEGEKCTAEKYKYWFEFDASLLDEKVFEMYNSIVPNKGLQIDFSSDLIYNESTKKYRYDYGGGDPFPPLHIRKFLNAEKVGNEIYIYDLYLYGVISPEDLELEEAIPNYKFFKSSTADIFNDNDVNVSYDILKDPYSLDERLLVKDILEKDTLKMAEYKHVFKLSDDNNWYWYSTSMVK